MTCPICGRPLGEVNVDRHHLIPKSRGGTEQFLVHKICHRKLHATFTEKQLEADYSTWEAIREAPEIISFIGWVSKKPSDFYRSTANAAAKR